MIDEFRTLDDNRIRRFAQRLPDEWLTNPTESAGEVRRRIVNGFIALKETAITMVLRRLELLRELPAETPEELHRKSRQNLKNFKAQPGL